MAIASSNIDVNSIVSQLMALERRPLDKLNVKEASYQAQLSAYGSLKGAVSSFQTAVQGLNSASVFKTLKATPSDSSVFSASASSSAVAGTYSLDISSLAQAQKLVAVGQTSNIAAIGAGGATTVTFDFGTITGDTFNSSTGKYGEALSADTTIASTTVTVADTSNLAVGAAISGVGIPVGATIASITDATHFELSIAATATGVAVPLQADATFTSNGNGSKTVTIDSSNNSLQGIRDAINAAKIGVTATIINDGSASPYRLVLSSDSMGASNSLKISVAGDASVSSLLTHNPADGAGQNLSETVTAQNASFKVNGVAVSKTSNTVSDVIEGVTLNLAKVTTSQVTLNVARDTGAATTAVSSFVKAYNDLSNMLKSVSAYDAATKQAAILQGDSTVRSLQSQLRSIVGTPITGTPGNLTTLSSVGVAFQKDGSLALNSSKLNSAMSNYFDDVASLFASVGTATDSLVSYNNAISTTKAGSYAVNISQVATQGSTTGSGAITIPLTINTGLNDTLDVAINGTSATVTLSAGTYNTVLALAAELQSKINGASAFSSKDIRVAVTESVGVLTLTSSSYGAASSVGITGGTAETDLWLNADVSANGVDVGGTIGGSATTGVGQLLSATTGDPQGLSILVNGGALGARGTLHYSNGYASIFSKWASTNLSSEGLITSRTSGIGKSIADIGKRRTEMVARLTQVEERLRAQFVALDTTLTRMNATSSYLTQQLSQLSKLNN